MKIGDIIEVDPALEVRIKNEEYVGIPRDHRYAGVITQFFVEGGKRWPVIRLDHYLIEVLGEPHDAEA